MWFLRGSRSEPERALRAPYDGTTGRGMVMQLLEDADDPTFRSSLDAATKASSAFALGAITDEVERLAAENGRHITCLRCARRTLPSTDPASPHVNCHAYALGLYRTLEFQRILTTPDFDFIDELIAGDLLIERLPCDARDNDLVVYRSATGKVTHSGFLVDRFVHSKWGEGSLFEHTLFAAPARYGSDVKFFCPPKSDEVVAAYLAKYGAA